LVNQARFIVKNMDNLKKNNEELQRSNDEFNEIKYKEIKKYSDRKKIKICFRKSDTRIHSRISHLEKRRDEALSSLNI